MTGTRTVADREQLARESLADVTRAGDVGPFLDSVDEGDGVVTLHFAADMPGYPGWRWTVSLAEVDGEEPTVLETELLPGDGALLAPDWVPWSERLEEWRAQQVPENDSAVEDDGSDEGGPDEDDADEDGSDEDGGADDEDDLEDDDDDDLEDGDDEDDDLGDDVYDGLDPEAAAGLDDPDADEDPDDEDRDDRDADTDDGDR